MTHIVHLIIDGLYKADFVDYSDDDAALKEAKKICLHYVSQFEAVGDVVRQKIRSMKNPPMENSPQWEVLFQKIADEEIAKRGG